MFAAENFELSLWEIEQVGEEIEAGGVGCTLHGRRRQPDFQDVSDPADDLVVRGPWLDAEGNGGVRFCSPFSGCVRHYPRECPPTGISDRFPPSRSSWRRSAASTVASPAPASVPCGAPGCRAGAPRNRHGPA